MQKIMLSNEEKEIVIKFLTIYDSIENSQLNELFYYLCVNKEEITEYKLTLLLNISRNTLYERKKKLLKIINLLLNK